MNPETAATMHLVILTKYTFCSDRGGEGSSIERTHFVHVIFVLNQEQYIFWFANVRGWYKEYLGTIFIGCMEHTMHYLGSWD